MVTGYPVGLSSKDERLTGIIERLRNGSSLISESRSLGQLNNVALKGALRMKLGKEKYEELIALVQRCQVAKHAPSKIKEIDLMKVLTASLRKEG